MTIYVGSVDTCPRADQVVDEQSCSRDCLNKSMNASMDCIQCIPGCLGELLVIIISYICICIYS